jgi:hypothetical protein
MSEGQPRTSWLDVSGWGAFLAASWTWCIGMFLPVLLVRDFGPMSFLVFAIPNIMGAIIMGMVLERPGASESLVKHHSAACYTFSFITLAFQLFFLCWLILGLDPSVTRWTLAPMLLVIVLTGRRGQVSHWTRLLAILVLVTSLGAGAYWLSKGAPISFIEPPRFGIHELAWLAPVCVFGFGLCPYLDLTFHAARQQAPGRAGTVAFVLGFAIFFFSMILLTVIYTGPLLEAAQRGGHAVGPGLAPAPIIVHMSVQLAFTIMLHRVWIEPEASPLGGRTPSNSSLLALVLGVAAALLTRRFEFAGLSGPEVTYRAFMAFYGLVFPAYVWVCVLPLPADRFPTRRRATAFAVSVLVAAPMYWLAFINGLTWWLAPALAVILVAGLIAREPRAAAA